MEAYRRLVAAVDERADSLSRRYRPHLLCRKGCYLCCANLAILPVEHFNLSAWLLRHGHATAMDTALPRKRPARDRTIEGSLPVAIGEGESSCPLLDSGGGCTAYPARPLICRVHGIPLAYPIFEYDQEGNLIRGAERMDLWCDLNFTGITEEAAVAYFDENGRIDMATLNRELEEINEEFIRTEEGARYAGVDRLTMEDLTNPET